MAELKHHARFMPDPGSSNDPYSDTHLYMGDSVTRGSLVVLPDLKKFVGAELKDEYKAQESRRKVHEERARRAKK